MNRYGAELADIIASLERNDWGTWQKVAALNGSEFNVICCCNSEKCKMVKVVQIDGHGVGLVGEMYGNPPGEMPVEIEKILDACKTNPTLKHQTEAYNRAKFDVTFRCKNRKLIDCTIGDVT